MRCSLPDKYPWMEAATVERSGWNSDVDLSIRKTLMWQFEATLCSLFCSDCFQSRHQLWYYSCGFDWNVACLFIYLKDIRQRQERHMEASLYLFLPISGQRERSRNVLSWSGWAGEIRWHLFFFIAFVAGAGSVGLGWLRRLLAGTDADLFLYFLPDLMSNCRKCLTRRRLCRPPRPRLLQRNNGGKKIYSAAAFILIVTSPDTWP